jgi:hypothetical protein
MARDRGGPCEVRTKEYDWGNYCPHDLGGVHVCEKQAGHKPQTLSEAAAAEDRAANEELGWHRCRCGGMRPVEQPFKPVGSGVRWTDEGVDLPNQA